MKYPIRSIPEAEEEALKQSKFLEEQRNGYSKKFRLALGKISKEISEKPNRYPSPLGRPDIQCTRMPKPFHKSHSVYYQFDSETVLITCLFNNSQNPEIWQA